MLTGNEIRIQIESGNIIVDPYDPKCIGPNSYDVHLGDELLVYTEDVLDPKKINNFRVIKLHEDGYTLSPNLLYLGHTIEYTENPNHIPAYDGRSSMARLGVFSHISAGFGDIGFRGCWTLEIKAAQPVVIYPGMRIGQLYWHLPDGEVVQRYSGKYNGFTETAASMSFMDREWRGKRG